MVQDEASVGGARVAAAMGFCQRATPFTRSFDFSIVDFNPLLRSAESEEWAPPVASPVARQPLSRQGYERL